MSVVADQVEAPLMGAITVLAISTTDTGWVDLLALAGMGSNNDAEAYFTFKAETANAYLFFSDASSASTDPSATSTSTATQADVIFAGTKEDYIIKKRSRYLKAIGTTNGYLRITRTSK